MMGWKHSATNAPFLITNLQKLREEIIQEYPIRDILVLGMGGSALGARVFLSLYQTDLLKAGVRVRVLDTTEPSSVQAILDDFNAAEGLVIVSSKSGSSIEPLCLAQIFFDRLSKVLGSEPAAAAHFISISDEATPLSQRADIQGWRGIISTPPHVGGRFSALTAFGLAPLVLAGIHPKETIDAAQHMQFICLGQDKTSCPAKQLADSVFHNLRNGRDKLIISYDEKSESFARWLEQLVAESLGKQGLGLIPLPMPKLRAEKILALNHPDIQNIELAELSPELAGGDMLRWMFAVEILASYLQLDPFDQPNVEAVKQSIRSSIGKDTQTSLSTHLDQQHAAGRIAGIDALPSLVGPQNFIVLMAWTPHNDQARESLEEFAKDLESHYGRPVVIAEGPSYLHASGQLYKGGPNSGIFVTVIQETTDDLIIPRSDYSLRRLYRAAFKGDVEVMLSLGRIIIKL
jgi:glucose-6-phosphate isomerase